MEKTEAKEELSTKRRGESVYGLQSRHLESGLVFGRAKFANRFVSNVFSGCSLRRMWKGTFEAAGYSNDISILRHKRTVSKHCVIAGFLFIFFGWLYFIMDTNGGAVRNSLWATNTFLTCDVDFLLPESPVSRGSYASQTHDAAFLSSCF